MHWPAHGFFDNILNFLNIIPLRDKRSVLFSNFPNKLIFGLTDCPDLFYSINFKINFINSRNPKPFYPNFFLGKNDMLNCPTNLLITAGNTYTFYYN